MVGDRVESGYNRHDVFYQLRQTSSQWFIYCHINPDFGADPVYGDNYDKWLKACEGTANHPIALDKGWVIVGIESTQVKANALVDEIDKERVAKEISTANLTALKRIGGTVPPI